MYRTGNVKEAIKYLYENVDCVVSDVIIHYIEQLENENKFLKEVYSGTSEFKSIERKLKNE